MASIPSCLFRFPEQSTRADFLFSGILLPKHIIDDRDNQVRAAIQQ